MKKKVQALILTGDGINCENETALAFSEHGCETKIMHVQDLIDQPGLLSKYQILALPGGFSFGDEIGSGQILALKLKYSLGVALTEFINNKKLIIGICNGFQVLVRLGLLPKPFTERQMTLTHNRQGYFINKWVNLTVPQSKCIWTKSLQGKEIALPIRHGEGKITFAGDQAMQHNTFQSLMIQGQIALSYTEDVNGSYQQIAGVTDPTGCILGLMPHPEAATSNWLLPDGTAKKSGQAFGQHFFINAIKHCEEML
ncbi:MAG: phosphoribosylformylglycinamidine synthase subunit PurQ [Bdellovibrionota bacterium]